MKRLKIKLKALLLPLMIASSLAPAHAQFTSDYFYVGGSFAYSTLLGSVKEMSVVGNFGAGFHFGYELRTAHLLLRAGGDIQYFSSQSYTKLEIADAKIVDTRLGKAVMHYDLKTPLQETQQFALPGVSFMAGYSTNDYKQSKLNGGFYVLGGLKAWFKHDVKNVAYLQYETSATYERYIDIYEGMDDHDYTVKESRNDTISYGEKGGFKVLAVLSAEVGWEYNFRTYDNLKLAFFMDLGLNNVMSDVTTKNYEVNRDDASEISIYSYYSSTAMKDKWVMPLMAGFKVSYSFNLNRRRNCHSKDCNVGYRQKR